MDSSAIDNALLAKLGADAVLLGLMPNGVYYGTAPPGATRYVTLTLADELDVAVFGQRAQEELRYRVVAVGLSSAHPDMEGAAARLDDLLEDQAFDAPGFTWATTHRVGRVREKRADLVAPTLDWQTRGGVYRVVCAVGP